MISAAIAAITLAATISAAPIAAVVAPPPTLSAPSVDLTMEPHRLYTLEELNNIEAIKRLKARYFRMLDTKQWAAWGQVFAPDAVLRVSADNSITGWSKGYGPKIAEVVGRDNIVAAVSKTHARTLTVHHGYMPEIEITSPTTAHGIWEMEDRADTPTVKSHGWGHYEETYELIDGQWYIKTLHLTRLRLEETQITVRPD